MIAIKTKFKHDNNNVNKCLKEKKRLNTLQYRNSTLHVIHRYDSDFNFYCYFEISQIFKRLDSIWYKITDSHIFDARNLIWSVPLKTTFTEGMWKYDHYLRDQSLTYNSQNFRKIQRFLPPDKHTYVYVSGGKKC